MNSLFSMQRRHDVLLDKTPKAHTISGVFFLFCFRSPFLPVQCTQVAVFEPQGAFTHVTSCASEGIIWVFEVRYYEFGEPP